MEELDSDATEGMDPLIFGRVLDGQGGARIIGRSEVDHWRPQAPGAILWLHLRRNALEVEPWLVADLGIPEVTAALLVSDSTRPRALREGNALIATLRGINFNPGAQPEDMIPLQLRSDGTRLITLQDTDADPARCGGLVRRSRSPRNRRIDRAASASSR